MPRDARPFNRLSSVTEVNKIFLIVAEGYKTEYFYLDELNKRHGKICKLVPFKRPPEEASHSAPNKVLNQLKKEASRFTLKEGDSCWLVVDRDSWGQLLIDTVNECKRLQYNFIINSPCFEIWLLLYFKKISELTDEQKSQLISNKYITSRETFIEKLLTSFMAELKLGKYKANRNLPDFFFIPSNIKQAIEEARSIELKEISSSDDYDFPTQIGSQMYKMIALFFQENNILVEST